MDRQDINNRYIGNFDIVKILAATLIVFHHYQQMAGTIWKGINFYGGEIPFGYLVEIFFTISGFLTMYTYKGKNHLKGFLLNKFKRYYPYAFIACIVSLVTALFYFILWSEYLFDINYSIPTIITSLLLVHQGWIKEYAIAVNNVTWYLCVLTLCLLLFYIISNIFKNRKKETCVFSLISISMVPMYYVVTHLGFEIPFMHLTNVRGYAGFFLGCLMCRGYTSFPIKLRNSACFCLWIIGIIGICVGIPKWYLVTYIISPALLMTALIIPQFHSKRIKILGAISFEVYLWHVPVYGIIMLIMRLFDIEIKHSYLTMCLFGVLVWLFSFGVYKLVEIPLNSFISKKLKN